MHNGFAKGILVGGIIAASVTVMANSDMMKPGNRRRMMKAGRNFVKRSGSVIGNLADMLR